MTTTETAAPERTFTASEVRAWLDKADAYARGNHRDDDPIFSVTSSRWCFLTGYIAHYLGLTDEDQQRLLGLDELAVSA